MLDIDYPKIPPKKHSCGGVKTWKGSVVMKKHTMRTVLIWMLLLTTLILSVACGNKKNQETETQPVPRVEATGEKHELG